MKGLHPQVTDELKDITKISDERLEEIDNWALGEAREWQTLIEMISLERTRRKREACTEHAFYPEVAEAWCGDSGSHHEVQYSDYSKSFIETCSECGPIWIKAEQEGTENYLERCGKCGFWQYGLTHCKREAT